MTSTLLSACTVISSHGIRLHDTKKLPFEERIANVHELGFACGHLAPGKVITEFPTTDEALTPGLAMYMKNVFAKNQVDVAVLGCYLNLANPNPEQLAKITHRYMAHIRFASDEDDDAEETAEKITALYFISLS